MPEKCYFIIGFCIWKFYVGFLRYHSIGENASVDFDFEAVMAQKCLLGWYHSHPEDIKEPSETDDKTMGTWVRAMGKPLLCGIISDIQNCYIYDRSGRKHIESILLGNIFFAWKL